MTGESASRPIRLKAMESRRETVVHLLEYHAWATQQVLDSVVSLSHEELNRDMMTSHSGVWGTLVHIYQADKIWLDRHRGLTDVKLNDYQPAESLEGLRGQWAEVQRGLLDYAATLPENSWSGILQYRLMNGTESESPIYENLLHVVHHGTYHRGQVTTMLRQLGAKPIPTDYIRFVRISRAADTPSSEKHAMGR